MVGGENSLTFSGMLNALDGVGGQHGQIFILTTNHREHLDPALIRNGRVDLHVEFTDATEEQMIGLFKSFYAAADDALATAFAKALQEKLGDERTISMAALQHYFIQQRKATAEEASAQVEKVIEEMENMGKSKKAEKATSETDFFKAGAAGKATRKPTNKADEQEDDDGDAAEEEAGAAARTGKSGKTVHLHIH